MAIMTENSETVFLRKAKAQAFTCPALLTSFMKEPFFNNTPASDQFINTVSRQTLTTGIRSVHQENPLCI